MDVDRLTLDGIRPLTVSIPGGKVPTFDPVTQRQLTKLKAFTDWVSAHAAGKGCIGEVGWPQGQPYSTVQAAQWNAVGEAVYQAMDAAGLDVFYWAASTNNWAQPNGAFEGNSASLPKAGDPVRPLYTAFAQMGVVNQHLKTGTLRRGIAIATPLNSWPTANAIGSTWGSSNARESSLQSGSPITFTFSSTWEQSFSQILPPMYNYGSPEDYAAIAALGFRSVRLPIRWERLQRTFNSALDATELARLDAAVAAAAAVGIGITFSLHNFGGYMLDNGTQGVMQALVSGTPGVNQIPLANLTDFWTRFSAHYKNVAGVEGYELMNEPGTMSQADWITASAACVDAIRTTNTDTAPRLVIDLGGGGNYSNIGAIGNFSAQGDWIAAHDSTGNYRFKVDFYFNDANGGGGGGYADTYTTELASAMTNGFVAPGFPLKSNSPTSSTFSFFSTASATPVVISGGTVAWAPSITFKVPQSGVIIAEVEGQMAATGTLADTAALCLMDGATIKAARVVASVIATDATIRWFAVKATLEVTSLTPGAVLTYKPALQVSNVRSTAYIGWGGTTNPGSSARFVIKAGQSGQYPGE